MRAPLSTLEVVRPRTLAEALRALAAADRPAPLAGGTDVFVYLNAGEVPARCYLDLSPLGELRGIRLRAGSATIGALTTFWEIREHPAVRRGWPALAAAASEIGAWTIQHRATLGGNIANASPAGDSLPVLLACDAVVRVGSLAGTRDIPAADLFRGYKRLALGADELILSVTLPPLPRGARSHFRKVGTRRAQSISKVVMGATLRRDRRGRFDHVRLAFGSVAPVPLRATRAEQALLGQRPDEAATRAAREALMDDITPIDDIRSDAAYRRAVAGNLLAMVLRAEAAGR